MPDTDALIGTARVEVQTPEFETQAWVFEAKGVTGSGVPRTRLATSPEQLIAEVLRTFSAARDTKGKAVFVISANDSTVISTVMQILQWVPNIIRDKQQHLQTQVTKLVEAMLPQDPTEKLALEIADENAVLRRRFMSEWPSLTSKQVHEGSGSKGKNAALTASRWRRQGKVFAIPFRNVDRYPAFQFSDGRPKDIVAKILKEVAEQRTPWQIAFWFVAENGWLDGRRPIDLMDAEPDLVIGAARREVDEAIF